MINKNPYVFVGTLIRKYTLCALTAILFSLNSVSQTNSNSVNYFEDFNSPGYPANTPANNYWSFQNEIHPDQDAWNDFIPGDGNAYIKVDADTSNDLNWVHPFQTLIFGGVGENHRLEVRMKGAVVDGGLVGFLFTYEQTGSYYNEVDIAVVANDTETPDHPVLPENEGYTDVRFNSWGNAHENLNTPFTGSKKSVVNEQNEKISLIDEEFHTYTIDWREDRIEFFIDNVLQETITTSIATKVSEVIIGFRQLPWANDFNWSGTHTMVIDYLKVEPLEVETFATNDNISVEVDTAKYLDVLANDSDNTKIISFDTISEQGFPVSGTSTLLAYAPYGGYLGSDSFSYTIEDEDGKQASATVNITVIPGPLMAVNDAVTIAPGSNDVPINVLANDEFGPNGASDEYPLTFANGTTESASVNGGLIFVVDGKITYSTPEGFTGSDSFQYNITDAAGFADSATVSITVGDTEVANAVDDSFSTDMDTQISLDVLANDSANTTIVSFDALSNEGYLVSGSTALLKYTPSGGFIGNDTFNYTIEDENGIQSTATVTITVEDTSNYTGTLSANNDNLTIEPDSSNILIDVTDNDNYGINGKHSAHPLVLINGKMSTATDNGGHISVSNGKINYTSPNGFIGLDSFVYTITDGNGFSDSATVNVTIGDPITANAVDDSFYTEMDAQISLDVLANDTANTTIVSFDELSTQGFVVSGTTSILNYTPSNGFLGTDTFTYTIEDENGGQSSATVTISVEEPVNATGDITAIDDAVSVTPGSSNTLINVTNNDTFGKWGKSPTHPLTLTNGKMSHASDQGGTLNVINGKISYTTPNGFTGEDTFTYTITDINGFADSATVTINVGDAVEINAVNDSYSTEEDTPITLDVLANDSPNTTIVSYDTLSTEGQLISGAESLLTYAPSNGFTGTDTFNYTIEDSNGTQSTATVTITVKSTATNNNANSTKTAVTGDDEIIDNSIVENKFSVYPNPSNDGYIKTTLNSENSSKAILVLYNIRGKEVYRSTIDIIAGKNEYELSVNIKPGLVFMKILSAEVNYGTTKILFK